ncbi:MAG TPA: DNA sulfur modification protein DndD [Candidatus Tumulicola sp.]|nr:DNA sulfur modification protein DndD [Candidatus Tumulicola sp.]
MILRNVAVHNYSVFGSASFDLSTHPDKPIVLFYGSNGAGKTSLLQAFRLALHGRRSFSDGISETDYLQYLRNRFHNGQFDRPCSIALAFDFAERSSLKRCDVVRSWTPNGRRIDESLSVTIENHRLAQDEAEEFLNHLMPPEVLQYFFFDAEKVAYVADWDHDDDTRLFACVDELLGLQPLDQLQQDLEVMTMRSTGRADSAKGNDLLSELSELQRENEQLVHALRESRKAQRAAVRAYDDAKRRFRALGGVVAQERQQLEARHAELDSKIESLSSELSREANALLPLLVTTRVRERVLEQLTVATRLEEIEALARALKVSSNELHGALLSKGLRTEVATEVVETVRAILTRRPVGLSARPLVMSLAEATWMQSVLTTEVPRLGRRVRSILAEHESTTKERLENEKRLRAAPVDDPKADAALKEMEERQSAKLALDNELDKLSARREEIETSSSALRKSLKKMRQKQFTEKRTRVREQMIVGLRAALPQYASTLRSAKEVQFADLLTTALQALWHKKDRLARSEVSFVNKSVKLFDQQAEISKSDLSEGEKQLFATAFVFALAKLSNRRFPFVIDTPLGRLDRRHRQRFVSSFLPRLSHQVILFSTDSEIVGKLYTELRPLITTTYDLADFNDRVTPPIQLEVAL